MLHAGVTVRQSYHWHFGSSRLPRQTPHLIQWRQRTVVWIWKAKAAPSHENSPGPTRGPLDRVRTEAFGQREQGRDICC